MERVAVESRFDGVLNSMDEKGRAAVPFSRPLKAAASPTLGDRRHAACAV